LHIIRPWAEPPSLWVLDVMMPKLSGLHPLARLREDPRSAGVPAVLGH
jgi:CheY-like chemotaxis protein